MFLPWTLWVLLSSHHEHVPNLHEPNWPLGMTLLNFVGAPMSASTQKGHNIVPFCST